MPTTEIMRKFGESAKAFSVKEKQVYKNLNEWEQKGLLMFKRRVLGFCGVSTTKSLEELAIILTELKVVDSVETGKQLIPQLEGSMYYSDTLCLRTERVSNNNGQEAYRITREDNSK